MSIEDADTARGCELNNIDKQDHRPLQPVGFPHINNKEQYFIESRVSLQRITVFVFKFLLEVRRIVLLGGISLIIFGNVFNIFIHCN